jgi:hypothetical protein
MSHHNESCEPPFWKNPMILFHHFTLEYKPECDHTAWNFVFRIILVSLFLGLIASLVGGLPAIAVALLFGTITAFAIILSSEKKHVPLQVVDRHDKHDDKHNDKHVHNVKPDMNRGNAYHSLPFTASVDPSGVMAPVKEHFVNGGSQIGSVQPVESNMADTVGIVEVDAFPYSGPSLPDHTPPTSRNLFMNVLLDEMKYNPDRPASAPVDNAVVKQTLDDYFRVSWFSDPTDVFGKNQNQRQYVTQPSTTVPNDQGSFADWLYKIPGKTCKEGGRAACLGGTDGGLMPWLSHGS